MDSELAELITSGRTWDHIASRMLLSVTAIKHRSSDLGLVKPDTRFNGRTVCRRGHTLGADVVYVTRDGKKCCRLCLGIDGARRQGGGRIITNKNR